MPGLGRARADARPGPPRAHHVQVVGGLLVRRGGAAARASSPRPASLVGRRERAAALVPVVEPRQGHAQDRGLERVEPRVPADLGEGALVARAVEAQLARPLGDAVVVGRDRARRRRGRRGSWRGRS